MSTDANDKAHSKFPRASLRARNRTIMMAPADLEDFKPEPRKTKSNIKIEDILEDSLGSGEEGGASHVSSAASLDSILTDVFSDSPVPEGEEGTKTEEPPVVSASEESLASLDLELDQHLEDLEELTDVERHEEKIAVNASLPESFHSEEEQPVPPNPEEEEPELAAPIARIVRTADTRSAPQIPEPVHQVVTEPEPDSWMEQEEMREEVDEVEEDQTQPVRPEEAHAKLSHSGVIGGMGREYVEWRRPSKLVGFLVSFEVDRFGTYIELREGRLLVSCERGASDNCVVISHASISPMHAILRVASDGTILILDQLSEHGTKIKRCSSGKEETLLGDKSNLEHGDVVKFGECAYHVCILKGI